MRVVTVTQATLDQLEEFLEEVIALEMQVIDKDLDPTVNLEGFHLEQEGPMAAIVMVGLTIDLIIVVVTIKPKVKVHLKVIEVEQCPQEG